MDQHRGQSKVRQGIALLLCSGFIGLAALPQLRAEEPVTAASCSPTNTIHADVVALDQVIMINRLGTVRPEGMIYALLGDVLPITGTVLAPGNATLRGDKRPRPLVLRVRQGDCLEIEFHNFLSKDPLPVAPGVTSLQAVTRNASIHVAGMQLVKGITDDGTYVGANPKVKANFSGVVPVGGAATYTLYAAAQGSYLMYSTPGDFNGFNNTPPGPNEQLTLGLFGAVNVEPQGPGSSRSTLGGDRVWRGGAVRRRHPA